MKPSQVLVYSCVAATMLAAAAVDAAEAPLTGGSGIALPSVTRVLFALFLVSALAVGITVLLKRVLPKLPGQRSASSMRVLDRIHLHGATNVHLLQVESSKVLVAENRHGIAIHVLDGSQHQDSRSQS